LIKKIKSENLYLNAAGRKLRAFEIETGNEEGAQGTKGLGSYV